MLDVCHLFKGIQKLPIQTSSLIEGTIANISRAELQGSDYLVISWSFPSFLFKESKMDFRPVYTHI